MKTLPRHAERLYVFGEWMSKIVRGFVLLSVLALNSLGLTTLSCQRSAIERIAGR